MAGRRVVVTRAQEQAESLTEALRRKGADVVEAPAIRIEPPEEWAPVDRAIRKLGEYDWILFTSVNGVRFFLERLRAVGRKAGEEFARVKLGAIGPATSAALEREHLRVDIVPERFVAEEVFEALRRVGPLAGSRILLPRADIARQALADLLRGQGARVDVVTVYRTVSDREAITRAVDLVVRGEVDVVTFTSGSTVRSFFSAVENRDCLQGKLIPASIGPITSEALREHGFAPAMEAKTYTSAGLAEAIVDYFSGPSAGA